MEITNQNLVVLTGGHAKVGFGSQTHYPIFIEEGIEYVSLDGQTLRKVSDLSFENTRRETVER
jgi:hypothetical protein